MTSRARLNVLNQAHAHAQGLSPAEIYPEGLTDLLAALARDTQAATGIRCRYEGSPALRVADSNVALHLYHIAEDAVRLVFRRGKPHRIDLHLTKAEGVLTLTVQADVRGTWGENAPQESHLLPLLRFRVGVLGGRFRLEPVVDGGMRLRCAVPVAGPGTCMADQARTAELPERRNCAPRPPGKQQTSAA